MKRVSMLRIFLVMFVFMVLFFTDVGYTNTVFQGHPGQSILSKNPMGITVTEVFLQKINSIWPGEKNLFIQFDKEVEDIMYRARIQRKYVLTAA